MKLHEHDKYEGSLRARKSYHFLGDKIVCLGSDIRCSDADYPTETTLFQLTVPTDSVAAYWANPVEGRGWWLDHLQTGYYVPRRRDMAPARLELHRGQQSESNEGVSGSGDWVTLTADHGTAPQGSSYRYAILPQTTAERMKALARRPDFEVLRQDSVAHIVADRTLGVTSYVLFEPCSLRRGVVAAADTPCLVMASSSNTDSSDSLLLTVANPDLGLYSGPADELFDADGRRIERSIYSRPWKFNECQTLPVHVTLRGLWLPVDTANPRCRVVAQVDGTTILEFACREAASIDVELMRIEKK
jgi:chondroitin-sulfate-ABC endolyase/exolyase